MTNPAPAAPIKIYEFLEERLIFLDSKAGDRDSFLRDLARPLALERSGLSEPELYDKLLQREKLGTTAIGGGYAIPHCVVQGLEKPVIAVAVSRNGISFYSADGRPSSVFFVVVSSAEDANRNLQVLAGIAQLIRRSGELFDRLLRAKTPREVLDTIREEEEKAS
jgi:PTS system nitrogen regulatory IIA component